MLRAQPSRAGNDIRRPRAHRAVSRAVSERAARADNAASSPSSRRVPSMDIVLPPARATVTGAADSTSVSSTGTEHTPPSGSTTTSQIRP